MPSLATWRIRWKSGNTKWKNNEPETFKKVLDDVQNKMMPEQIRLAQDIERNWRFKVKQENQNKWTKNQGKRDGENVKEIWNEGLMNKQAINRLTNSGRTFLQNALLRGQKGVKLLQGITPRCELKKLS
jgi:hypothetical protein